MIHANPIKVIRTKKSRVLSLTRELWFSLSARSQVKGAALGGLSTGPRMSKMRSTQSAKSASHQVYSFQI